jgi:PhoH-like ATPase
LYSGIHESILTDEELANFYSGSLHFDLLQNQYLILKNEKGDIVDKYKNENGKLVKVKYKSIENKLMNKIKARNSHQEILLDLLDSHPPVMCVIGKVGSGKSFISTAYALQEIDKGKYNKLVIIRNNLNVADVESIGAIPGDTLDKLKPFLAFISDIISDYGLELLLNQNKIEMVYLGTIRGRSLSDSFILVSECQNLTTNLVKTILSRVGENSVIVFDGDLDQIDKKVFEKDNGLVSMIESLKGHKLFGVCELVDIERSEVAKLAALIK